MLPNHAQNTRINDWIARWISTEGISSPVNVVPLAGDGSQRTFYRIETSGKTLVLLSDPGWSLSKDYAPHQAYLLSCGIPVPTFLKEDPAVGMLLMEDLGDELVQNRITSQPAKKITWLREAALALADLHGKTYPVPSSLPVATRHFDTQKYFEELCFTFEHLHEKFLGLPPFELRQMALVKQYCQDISLLLPEVFCHRDYHCRNLLVKDDKLVFIDFQDARLGPPHYDLASLVYDAYMPVTSAERAQLVQAYKTQLQRYELFEQISWESFSDDLEMIAFQRVAKAAGSFASFYTRFKKDTHLQYLPTALESLAQLLSSCSVLPKEFETLFPVDKWLKTARPLIEKLGKERP